MNGQTVKVTELLVQVGNKCYMHTSLYPGMWREVPISLFKANPPPWEVAQ